MDLKCLVHGTRHSLDRLSTTNKRSLPVKTTSSSVSKDIFSFNQHKIQYKINSAQLKSRVWRMRILMTPRREAWRGNISSNYQIVVGTKSQLLNQQSQSVNLCTSVRTYPSDMNWCYLTERLSLLGAVLQLCQNIMMVYLCIYIQICALQKE